MKFYFVYMQNPNNSLFYNIGDFCSLNEALEYACDTNYTTRIKQVTEEHSSVIVEGNVFGRYGDILQALAGNEPTRLTDED